MEEGQKHFVILGGGTAGWMAASLLQHHLDKQFVKITLVESPDIGIVGVGEGSTPTLKRFFQELGIAESTWMPKCNATYKANIRFVDWSPELAAGDYSHPFISKIDTFSERAFFTNCLTRRLGLDVETRPGKFLLNGYLSEQQLAPVTPENFPFRVEYGYHFDSALLGNFLKQRAIENDVNYVAAKISDIAQHSNGDIESVITDGGEAIAGDFFIDCSGFRSVLLQQKLKTEFLSFKDNLFNDSAVVFPTEVKSSIPVETKATALSNGWAWQIPLTHRTGNGYVYSSDYLSSNDAEKELRQHLGILETDVEARHLKMKVGQVAQHWKNNCLGVGLSAGFIEPLEATALHLVQTGIEIFIDAIQENGIDEQVREQYNRDISERFERVRDYIVAHYKLNTRQDTDYWKDNRDNMHLSESLLQILDVWYRKGKVDEEVRRQNLATHFGAVSWHCLLAGYGHFPPIAPNQPGKGDLFKEQDLEKMFKGSALNFIAHRSVLESNSQ